MLTKQFWRKLSHAAATAALSVTILSALETAPVRAVQLRTFNVSGKFVSQASPEATGLPVNLANGSFDGTYVLDLDQTREDLAIPLLVNKWNINLRNSSNTILETLSNSVPNSTAWWGPLYDQIDYSFSQEGITFALTYLLTIGFPNGERELVQTDQFAILNYAGQDGSGSIAAQPQSFYPYPYPDAVPEPFTIGGTVVAGAIGLYLKRKKQKSSQSI